MLCSDSMVSNECLQVLFRTRFDEGRVTTCVKNVNSDIKAMLREGSTVCSTLTCVLTAHQMLDEAASGKSF